MYKDEMILSTLEDIEYSIELILQRFADIKSSDDFFKDLKGLEILDSISMRLIAIGEGFKHIDRLSNHKLLQKYPAIAWKDVKGVRDILSHHYFNIDAEIVFDICKNDILELLKCVKQIQNDVKMI